MSALAFSQGDGVGECGDVRVFLAGGAVWLSMPVCAGEWHRGSACLGFASFGEPLAG